MSTNRVKSTRHVDVLCDGGMEHERLVTNYLEGLAAGDAEGVVSLFATDGVVHSPLYGSLPARNFYPALFADTKESRLTLRTTMAGALNGRPVISFWFDFAWTLASGEPAPFTVVDVAELDEDGHIVDLHIVYDTALIREAFNRQHRRAEVEGEP